MKKIQKSTEKSKFVSKTNFVEMIKIAKKVREMIDQEKIDPRILFGT